LGHLSFQNVSFSYPSRPNAVVLKGCTLDVYPGQRVAVVGKSGSGKSTLTKLAFNFYSPAFGRVLLDGEDVATLPREVLCRKIAIVEQSPSLLPLTILENMYYGVSEKEHSSIDVFRVSRMANCHEFIDRLPMGANTTVGENGVALSAGQRQRLAIARALLRQPKVLLLDEATSSLDSESEELIREAVNRASQQMSVLVIAHRLNTIKNSDVIYVLEDGAVAEKGSHDELCKKENGIYRQMIGLKTV